MDSKKYFIAGLPSSGKTTFLAALYCILMNRSEATKLFLPEEGFPNGVDLQFKKLADCWLSFEPFERTKREEESNILFKLLDSTQNQYSIQIPDLSGEKFVDLVKNRFMDDSMKENILNADEFILFINYETMYKQELITELPQELLDLKESNEEVNSLNKIKEIESDSNENEINKDEIEYATQTSLVEILQFISQIKKDGINIKIIFSAWDVIMKNDKCNQNPIEFAKNGLPLLYQYIENNSNKFNYEFWGVSAQGCDLNILEEVDNISNKTNLLDRIIVVDSNDNVDSDLSRIFCDR